MQRSTFLALVSASLLLSAGSAMAAGDVTQSNEMNGLLRMLYQAASEWSPRLQGYALKLLASLALIQLVWTFMPLVMKQADLGEVVGELIRFFMVIGFFYAVIEHSVPWATAVVDSFREAAGTASGLGRALQPGDMFAVAVNFSRTIVEGISLFSPGKAVLIALVGCLVLLCFAFIAAFMFVTLVESYIIINASVLFFGFGGSQWTRDFAIAPLRFVVAVGAKLFVLTLIVGIIVTSAKSWLAAYTNDEASLMTLAGLALVCAYLTKTIPELIGGMISGTSMGGGSALGGMAAAGAAGAAAAVATIATAGAAAPAAAGALGAAGSGASAAGAAGSGGLTGAINSSFAGAANSGTGAAASMGNAAPSGVGASTGGGAALKGSTSAGSSVGGSTANARPSPAQRPNSGVQQAAKQAGKAMQDNDDKDKQQETPKRGTEGSGNALSQAANGGAKVLGVMASMAVPGMENAHGLSLGAGSAPPSNSEVKSAPINSGGELAADSEQGDSNVIRPASDAIPTNGRLASLSVPGTASNNEKTEK
ncbi:P-type conjugative transfer protein TrbL [Pseudomonas syringae pv. actinidiae]|uniref:P-type conjugative transfer protein TrbL n=1 Tax=Pseudomonas syringae TaxID=317 RepID=UPI000BB56500|nr:P-type conjugative transfer protein TrbL [Pseudomonas syringae]PBK51641.1 P-type conjugative transfer protein TrbL [Pseudomonas syringae pv. actinidiae]PBK55342.1 P-type conjugative transfer protein TrbL [Pseudomonas syringae pv. actinidiae]RJX58247.1 P-type conjugative transfer protein TrbL [Pseudomonas syringae pv. actinidiae]RJX63411.1 P-type conjugative transfer protein TrbL [Pseudomonas syringae pv. actinidiae]